MKSFQVKIGEQVEVYANSTFYRGKLMGISETDVYIKTPTRNWTIPLNRVQSLRYLPSKPLRGFGQV